jgi:ATP-dependent Clp protease ATP-binding subunit ClpC
MLPASQATKVKLTKRAQKAVELARSIAAEYGLGYVGTEHLLLGIIQEGTSVAAACLKDLGADEKRTKAAVDELVRDRMEETWVMGRLPGTPHYLDVLTTAETHAKGTGNWQVCSVHLLLGLLEEKDSVGCRALTLLNLDRDIIREDLAKRL